MNWFKPKTSPVNVITKFRVLEVDRPTKLPEMTAELKDSLRALQFSPAFQYLCNRFRLERANLKKYLEEGFQLSERELHHLQAGAFYAGWFEREAARLTMTPAGTPAEQVPDDDQLFKELQAQLEIVS